MDVQRDAALLDAALQLLSEVGYERLSLTEVCRRARASTKTVYRRWSNKDQLMAAALRRAVSRSVDEQVPLTSSGSLREDLVHNLLPSAVPEQQLTPQYFSGLLVAASGSDEVGRMAKKLCRMHHSRVAETVLGWARERGELGEGADPVLIADLARSALIHQVLVADGDLDVRFVESFVDRVLLPVLAPFRTGGAR
ncbi:TetR/AcrR family transcriptional regulator [Streptomyces justiciae]|uniref:TetR/AcrR family transcriptional regulator n=1 Tax=Streptomyces justiciae TaxID=2780140 RepID=UPI0021198945|nr:TetR/AcrR family transcriptional regulator [Streptomyces justiciae]MCW8384139.1 TetR/AcrR family transcriptional regulator [Streptomyces justiciae]